MLQYVSLLKANETPGVPIINRHNQVTRGTGPFLHPGNMVSAMFEVTCTREEKTGRKKTNYEVGFCFYFKSMGKGNLIQLTKRTLTMTNSKISHSKGQGHPTGFHLEAMVSKQELNGG